MPFKDILVHVDASDAGENRVNAAAAIAAKQEANLIGLFLEGTPYFPPMTDLTRLPPEYSEQQRTYAKADSENAKAMFIGHANHADP